MFLAGAAACLAAEPAAAFDVGDGLGGMVPPPAYVPPATLNAVMDIHSRMTAPVRVNGTGPYPFVVDTGSNQSVISDALAAQLGLSRGPPELVNSIAGSESAPTTQATLGVGSRSEPDVVLSILPRTSVGALGMLGVDRLFGQRLTLDFMAERLTIEDARRPRGHVDDIVMTAHPRDGQLTLLDAELGGALVTAFLDLGAERTIGNLALRDRLVQQRPLILGEELPVVSATGQTITAEVADVPDLRMGGLRLPNWPVAFAELHTFELWGVEGRPALIVGVDVLSRFESVSFDFLRTEVRFRQPS